VKPIQVLILKLLFGEGDPNCCVGELQRPCLSSQLGLGCLPYAMPEVVENS
jgi:hypothetical protein